MIVNRLWQHHFGEGIVRSPDDFGVMGQRPTHPELLDWLATEFAKTGDGGQVKAGTEKTGFGDQGAGIGKSRSLRPRPPIPDPYACGWSLKKLHRLMALSSAYRMASLPDAKAERSDPTNRLLQHMPVRRLEAEAIRDAILAVSGRLDRTLYGPSVMPYLTPFMEGRGLRDVSGPLDGAGRRSLYISVRRNFLTPMFLAFDYPVPFTTIGRRTVSSVPAQALTLMNNLFVVQQAEVWAKRVLSAPGRAPEQRLQEMYITAFSRPPDAKAKRAMLAFLREQNTRYGQPNDPRSWRDLCHVLFNLKEFIFIH